MFRRMTSFGVAALAIGLAVPVAAQDRPNRNLVAPSAAVAAAWAQEAREHQIRTTKPAERVERGVLAPSAAVAEAWAREADARHTLSATPASLKALYTSYGVLHGLDMYSTIVARRNGAREVNPIMNSGYGQATLVKALMASGTFVAARKIEKKNKGAAMITMVALNVATAAVVANNFQNARGRR